MLSSLDTLVIKNNLLKEDSTSEDIIKDSIEFTSKENLVGNRNTYGTLQELFLVIMKRILLRKNQINVVKKCPVERVSKLELLKKIDQYFIRVFRSFVWTLESDFTKQEKSH